MIERSVQFGTKTITFTIHYGTNLDVTTSYKFAINIKVAKPVDVCGCRKATRVGITQKLCNMAKGKGGLPSTTGRPSGKGRDNK